MEPAKVRPESEGTQWNLFHLFPSFHAFSRICKGVEPFVRRYVARGKNLPKSGALNHGNDFFFASIGAGNSSIGPTSLSQLSASAWNPIKRDEKRTKDNWVGMALGPTRASILHDSVDQINQKPRRKYWATRSSARSFARTAHLFACSALLAARTHLLTRSLRSFPHW